MESISIAIFLWLLMLIHLMCHDLSMPVTAAITTTITCFFLEIYQRCFHANGLQKIGYICSNPMNDICHFKFSNRTKIDAHFVEYIEKRNLATESQSNYHCVLEHNQSRTAPHVYTQFDFFFSATEEIYYCKMTFPGDFFI